MILQIDRGFGREQNFSTPSHCDDVTAFSRREVSSFALSPRDAKDISDQSERRIVKTEASSFEISPDLFLRDFFLFTKL